jgi:NAD-dependent DNA ligase
MNGAIMWAMILSSAILSTTNLYKQLETIEAAHPQLVTPDSPTQRVGKDLTENAPQVAHLTPMLSLDNSYNAEDLNDFDESVKKLCGLEKDSDVEYCVEPKYDGGTIALGVRKRPPRPRRHPRQWLYRVMK